MLRLVGRRFGPVLRTEPYDNAAQSMDWPEQLQAKEERLVAERRRTGRFVRETESRVTDRSEQPVQH